MGEVSRPLRWLFLDKPRCGGAGVAWDDIGGGAFPHPAHSHPAVQALWGSMNRGEEGDPGPTHSAVCQSLLCSVVATYFSGARETWGKLPLVTHPMNNDILTSDRPHK